TSIFVGRVFVYKRQYKYRIDARQKAVLQLRAQGVLERDAHAGADGEYLIRSLYFDSMEDACFFENENGDDPREKYRIRFYNCDTSRISLECKAKTRGMTKKTACPITSDQCRQFMAGGIPEPEREVSPGQAAMFTQMRLKSLRPVVIVQYTRMPFVCDAGNVRVTFDGGIASSNDIACFLQPEIPLRGVLGTGESILEVKWDELIPSYVRERLALDSLQWTSFSKYYLCRKYNCYGGVRI
ncbi:MAG: polyphosphate polymerase domain-containing protein, partial [Lachnospiraceae bacterium]|nr:polyphosphate polymerase domain-containing protein [Lachnospiraceae bacterium]